MAFSLKTMLMIESSYFHEIQGLFTNYAFITYIKGNHKHRI